MKRQKSNEILRAKSRLLKTIFSVFALLILTAFGSVAARAQAEERREQIKEFAYDTVSARVMDKYLTVKLSPQCWDRMLKGDGQKTLSYINAAIWEHAKLMGYGDFGGVGGGSDVNADRLNQIFGKMDGKFSYTIEAAQTQCSKDQWDVMSRFAYFVGEFFSDSSVYSGMGYGWRPRAGKMFVKVVFSPTAPDAAVAISADGANFTVTVPSGDVDDLKWNGWQKKIEAGMAKGGAKTAAN